MEPPACSSTSVSGADSLPYKVMPPPSDTIEIRRLRVSTHIGVPDEERALPQTLLVTVKMTPCQNFAGLADDVSYTINYYTISLEIEALAAARPRHLIETLATDIAHHLLGKHPLTKPHF